MIISRTPYRISFFGGGTDYPDYYLNHGGQVLASSIDKYCYLSCRYLPPFFEHKYRLVYSIVETCKTIEEIKHPAIRGIMKHMGIARGVEIHHDGDLPARSGMGSSSSFTVRLLNAFHALNGMMPSKRDLADQSIYVEQKVLRETVGSQDQVMAANGGMNHVTFEKNGNISVRPVTIAPSRIKELGSNLMLFDTCIKRTAANIAKSYTQSIDTKVEELNLLKGLVDEGLSILTGKDELIRFGELLNEGWQIKRNLSSKVSNPSVDSIYEAARRAGAVGGKLTGAGGGGFLLLFVPPHRQKHLKEVFSNLIHVPFKFESTGSQIIFCDRETDYLTEEKNRDTKEPFVFKELNPEEAAMWPS